MDDAPRAFAVVAERGVVAAGHAVPARVGVEVLRGGGNVVDAIVAAGFAAFVAEPAMCGIGGHGRLSVAFAGSEPWGIDHFLIAPRGATPAGYAAALRALAERYPDTPGAALCASGPLSVGVPGAVAGLCEAARRFGSLPLGRLLGPAIDLAEAGIPLDDRHRLLVETHAAAIRAAPELAAWLMPNGMPGPGDRLDGRDLARTLRRIAAEGAAAVHQGPIASAIERAVAGGGGLVTTTDLADYAPRVFPQAVRTYRDHRYVTCDDLIAIEALNVLECFAPDPSNETTTYHLLAEALAQALVDNFAFGGDPGNEALPLSGLASKDYARDRAATIRPDQARAQVAPGQPWRFGRVGAAGTTRFDGTTQICVLDRAGNGASLITSIDSAWGSLVLVPETGILLGNGLQLFGEFRHGRNPIAPGRMPLYGAPVMLVMAGDRARGALAGAGGYRIATGILNSFVNVVDRGMALDLALDHPRVHDEGDGLEVDARVPPMVQDGLARLGHRVRAVATTPLAWPFGRTSAVWRDESGLLHGASGPRCGAAAGW